MSTGPSDIPSLPSLGIPITVYKMKNKTPTLMAKLPNKEPGKAEAYLRRLSEKYIIGPCHRGVIQISERPVD